MRIWTKSLALAAALALAACSPAAQKPAATQAASGTLSIDNWSDYIDPALLAQFTKETGIKVRYDTFDSNEVLETKILQGHTGYDLVVPSNHNVPRYIAAKAIQPLDKAKLTGLANLAPDVMAHMAPFDPGAKYAVPYMQGTIGLGYNVDALAKQLPELPDAKQARFVSDFGLSAYDAAVLVAERETAEYFEAAAKGRDAKTAANWVINELTGRLNKEGKDIGASPVSAAQLGAMLDLLADGTISGKIAKDLFEILWTEGGDPSAIVAARGMKQVTDLGAIGKVVDDIIAKNPDKVADARTNPKAIGWFVGQVMKSSGGKASPQAVNDLLKVKLGL